MKDFWIIPRYERKLKEIASHFEIAQKKYLYLGKY